MITSHSRSFIRKVGAVAMLGTLCVLSFSSTKIVFAQSTANTTQYLPLTTIPGFTEANRATNPLTKIKNIYGVSIGIAAVLAVIMIIWAGLEYATTEAVGGKSDAKSKWQGAFYGLGLLLASYLLLRTINIDLVNINLNLGTPEVDRDRLVGADALANSMNEMTAAIRSNEVAVAQAKSAKENLESTIQALEEKLADPSLVGTDRLTAQRELDYASRLLKFRESDEGHLGRVESVNESIRAGRATNTQGIIDGLDAEIALIRALKADSTNDTRMNNALDQRLALITQKKADLATARQTIYNEATIAQRAESLYNTAKPSRVGLTANEFTAELLRKKIYSGNEIDTPMNIITNMSSGSTLVNTEINSMVKTYSLTYIETLNTKINNRVKCYEELLKQGRGIPAGCQPF